MAKLPAPHEGIVLTHFIVSGDVERSRRCYTEVLGGPFLHVVNQDGSDPHLLDQSDGSQTPSWQRHVLSAKRGCFGPGHPIAGASGPNLLRGGGGSDFIDSMAGHDRLRGMRGNDTLCAGPGNDTVDWGPQATPSRAALGTTFCTAAPATIASMPATAWLTGSIAVLAGTRRRSMPWT